MNKFLRILFASALVGALAFSCAKNVVKEEEAPEEKPVPAQQADKVHTSIEAYIMGDTKTDYLIENGVAKFQWVDDLDHLDVTVQKGEVISSVVFTKKDNGEEGNNYFQDGHVTGEASMADRTGFALSDWAFYPSRVSPEALEGSFVADWSYEGGKYLMDLPSDITIPAGKPLAVVPMAGKKDGINRYAFTQMTGVLAVPVSGLSGDEDFITLQSDDVALSGTFDITFTEQIAYLEQSKVQYKNENGITLHFSGLMGTETFYFPLPVGTIPAGLKLIAGNSADPDTQMEMVTQVNINIARGKIAQTPVLPFQAKDPQWETIGTATYTDDFLWTNNGAFTSAPTVTVTLERSGLNPNRYRINNPYTVASAQVSYTQTDPDSYFVFMVSDEGAVTYADFRTGVADSGGYPMKLVMNGSNSVVSSQKSGEFYELLFSTRYSLYTPEAGPSGQYWTKSNVIHLTANVEETWTKVLDGTFIDEKLWGTDFQNWGSTTVPIELYQSDLVATKFRVPNPYLIAKDQFGYSTYEEGITADPYLAFVINDGDAVRFTTFLAGIEDKPTGGKSMKVWYPLDWGSGYTTDAAKNLVSSYRSDGLPAEVELYPIYSNATTVSYKYTDQGANRIRLSFPEPETWNSVSTLRFKDDFIFNDRHKKPVDSNVEVTLEQSSLNPKRFRVANPYPALCDALGVTKYTTDVSEYIVMTVDDEDKITYEEFRPGVGDTSKELMICEPSDWNAQSGASAIVGNSRVDSYDASGIPAVIRLYSVYHEVGNYKKSGESGNYFYTRDNDNYGDVIVMAAALPLDSWNSIGTGRLKDQLVWSCAGLTDYAEAEFQQHANYPNKFRIAKPYPGANSSDWFVFDVTDPDEVTSTNYYVDYEVTASGKYSFKPWIRNRIDYMQYYAEDEKYSRVLEYQENGLPALVEIGPCYRGDDFSYTDDGYKYEIGMDHQDLAIEIIFPGCHPYLRMNVSPLLDPVKKAAHINVAQLTLSTTGTLQRMVIKVTGGDLTKMAGLRLWQDNVGGWMHSDYVAPNSEGIVTIDTFTKPSITGNINLNFWTNDDAMIGSAFHFDVQEVVVDGVSVELVKETDPPHLPGIVISNGGDVVNVRGSEETVASFRIPALVTSNAGTLIAAYDIRYRHSGDLVADIDVGVKRSTDGGNTWSDLIKAMDMGHYGYEEAVANGTMTAEDAELNNGIGDPCLLVDENTGRIFCFALWTHGHSGDGDSRSLAWAGKGFEIGDTGQFMMVYSDDDGITWSEPINLTKQLKKYDWRLTFQGPGRGITMSNGTLVIPMQHQEGENKTMHGLYPLNSGIAYSTDHGETWKTHAFAHPVTSEAAVAEVEPGKLLLSMRDETDSYRRRAYYTTDYGRTWKEHPSNGVIYGNTCEAGMLHINASENCLGKDITLISNPTHSSRSRMTIHASLDHGETYPYDLLIDSGGCQYSCMTMVDDSTVGILYESSKGSIFFQAIPLVDLIPTP